MDKTYKGYNQDGHAASTHLVTVSQVGVPGFSYHEELLEHHVRHSPDGFSWGYAGSGPAELARSLLWDYLGAEPQPFVYQAFKSSFVAQWPQDGNWEMTSTKIQEWLDWLVVYQSAQGLDTSLTVPPADQCPACDGTGKFGGKGSYYDHPSGKPCDLCNGSGTLTPLDEEEEVE